MSPEEGTPHTHTHTCMRELGVRPSWREKKPVVRWNCVDATMAKYIVGSK